QLTHISSKYSITLNTIIQTIWGILLGKYNHKKDIIFGSIVSGRPSTIAGVESMVGLFINAIPVRISFDNHTSFIDLVKENQKSAISSEPYHYFPLPEIQFLSELKQNLIDHILIFENYPISDQLSQDLTDKENYGNKVEISNVEVFEQSNYDFNFII